MSPSQTIHRSGPWTASEVADFLDDARIPMRLAANTPSGFPVILSLWFLRDGDDLLAAVHAETKIAKRLGADLRCAFEIAPNQPPYRGVRGQARARLETTGGRELLERLLDRYRVSPDSRLGCFLLARADEELVIRVTPKRVDSWDYSERMRDAIDR